MKVFTVDLALCNGCYCCQIACKDEHVANDWTPYAKPQPDTGQFWIGITEVIRGHVPHVKVTYTPIMCNHCDDAPCIDECKVDAIYKRDDGIVIIDPVKCTGCKICADTCPHNSIFFNEQLNIAQKCTGCTHLLDNDPEWTVPRCVDQCPTEALRFGEEDDFKEFISEAEIINPEAGTKSRVYYKSLPKKFVAGTLYDPAEKEVIIGATCTMKDDESGATFTAATNNFGDFWFKELEDDRTYTLTLEKDGNTKTVAGIITDIDHGLGDIPMEMGGA
ncbi:MAG: putative dimethyl sulfoxide reductase iron-sulfur subunit B [Candidatus Methanocomedens sp.]|nr:MAG: putative dimethyl sulfoxide reductase iron-sulfur subunit B [ANME-2 cluster archaeon]